MLQCPWSHIALDFITDLPKSLGNMVILVIVDRFSLSLGLIPLPTVPTAFETAELVFNQVFRYYGIPEDVVSDSGAQFMGMVQFHGQVGGLDESHIWLSSPV